MNLFYLLYLLCFTALGADSQAVFDSANEAYEQRDFQGALEDFESLVADGVRTGPILYNLGNSYLQSGDLGRAVASYRQAERLWPRNIALEQNLDFARNSSKAMWRI